MSLLVATLLADQILQHVVLIGGTLGGRRIAPFDPPLFAPSQFEFRDRLRRSIVDGTQPFDLRHDAELGWVPRAPGPRGRGAGDPRAEVRRRIVAVGCSFTFGEEVGEDETWAAQVERRRSDLEVLNFGVSAYGAGQSLLRLRREGLPGDPDEVWLGVVPQTLQRLESMYRPAHRHWTNLCWFKPRFTLAADGRLQLLPNPAATPQDTLRLLSDQAAFLAAVGVADRWIERSPTAYAEDGSRLAHHSGIARVVTTLLEAAGRPDEEDLWYQPEASAARLCVALVEAAGREVAAAGGARFRLLVLPGREDLRRRQRATASEGDGLSSVLREAGVEVLDFTPILLEAGVLDDSAMWMPGGHYSPTANELVAKRLAEMD